MKKIVKITENDLTRIVKRVISEMDGDKPKLDLDKFEFNMDDEEYDDNVDRIIDKFLDDMYSINYKIGNIKDMFDSISSFEDPSEDDDEMIEDINEYYEIVKDKLRDLEDYYHDKMEPNDIENVHDNLTGIYGHPLDLIHAAFEELDSIGNRPY